MKAILLLAALLGIVPVHAGTGCASQATSTSYSYRALHKKVVVDGKEIDQISPDPNVPPEVSEQRICLDKEGHALGVSVKDEVRFGDTGFYWVDAATLARYGYRLIDTTGGWMARFPTHDRTIPAAAADVYLIDQAERVWNSIPGPSGAPIVCDGAAGRAAGRRNISFDGFVDADGTKPRIRVNVCLEKTPSGELPVGVSFKLDTRAGWQWLWARDLAAHGVALVQDGLVTAGAPAAYEDGILRIMSFSQGDALALLVGVHDRVYAGPAAGR